MRCRRRKWQFNLLSRDAAPSFLMFDSCVPVHPETSLFTESPLFWGSVDKLISQSRHCRSLGDVHLCIIDHVRILKFQSQPTCSMKAKPLKVPALPSWPLLASASREESEGAFAGPLEASLMTLSECTGNPGSHPQFTCACAGLPPQPPLAARLTVPRTARPICS